MQAVPLVVIGLIVAALFIIPKVVFFVATSLILFFILGLALQLSGSFLPNLYAKF